MKILNLYAWIWWNRSLRTDADVVAVEYNQDIADVYKDRFPKDKVVVWDAHEYLRKNFNKFDFIWSSPPCQTHSSFRYNIWVRYRWVEPKYPDMTLYEEIIFLDKHFEWKRVVENVKPYYKPLIPWNLVQRHMFRSNFDIPDKKFQHDKIRTAQIPDLQRLHWVDLSWYNLKNKRQVLRNCVLWELWEYVLYCSNK